MSLKSSISSHVRISYRFYQFVTTRYTTDFYRINLYIQQIGVLAAQNNLKVKNARQPVTL